MEPEKVARLHEEIQKGLADLEAGRVRSGMLVIEELAFSITVNQGLTEIHEGKTLLLDEVKRRLGVE